MTAVIWWIRRDLRLHDNPALQAALDTGLPLLPLFILDPHLLTGRAEPRENFLLAGLAELEADLRKRGSRLVVRRGSPVQELARLCAEVQAQAVFALEDYSPYSRHRDEAVSQVAPLNLFTGVTVQHPAMVRKADGGPYTVFTPFSKAWKQLHMPKANLNTPDPLPPVPAVVSAPLPAPSTDPLFPPGEREALYRLETFLHGPVEQYADDRNRMDLEGTSALSPYFRFGMLSPRLAANRAMAVSQAAKTAELKRGAETWLNELIWREFNIAILYHFPQVLRTAFNPGLRSIAWRDAPEDFDAWKQGRTGYPVVDAAMRQLNETGWMHNRARMIVASFLVKDLLIDWREGERWFFERLVDGDPAANNGGWQWTAGVGTDAAPYFRIFNPVLQGQRFDPSGDYVRRWVPELAGVPLRHMHAPWQMPEDVQRQCGVVVGRDYPAPIVDHDAARGRTLAAFKLSKG